MKTPLILLVLALGLGGLGLLAFGRIGDNLVYYWSPKELVAQKDKAVGATIRLGGQVAAGSIQWNPQGTDLAFSVTDGEATVRVEGKSIPPQMFREGIGVVVEGTVRPDGVFVSETLMVKHNNEYRAPTDHPASVEELSRTVQRDP